MTVSKLVVLALLSSAGACLVDPSPSGVDSPVEVARSRLTADRAGLWPDPYIVVCWEQKGFAAEKELVRAAVEDTWMRHSRLVFAGWGECDSTMSGIHIAVDNGVAPADPVDPDYGWPRTLGGLGAGGSARSDMRLTFDFVAQAAHFSSCASGVRADLERCIGATAVHEFGHALGFAHEQERRDASVQCVNELGSDYPSAGQGLAAQWDLGPFDQDSIMAFCDVTAKRGATLTPNDIFYLQQVYGRKAAGSLVAFRRPCRNCLTTPQAGSSPSSSSKVAMKPLRTGSWTIAPCSAR